MADISEWSPVDESNNQTPPNGFPEGMAPSGLNNGSRAVMGAVRRFYDQAIDGTLTLPYLPLVGGTLSGSLSATQYNLSGVIFAGRDASLNLHYLVDADGYDASILLGGAASGYINYYRAEQHVIQSNNGAATFATINTAGVSTPGTVSAAVLSAVNVFASGNIAATGALTAATVVGGTVHANTTLSAGISIAAPTIAASGDMSAANLSTASSISAGTWINAPQYRLAGVPIDFGTMLAELQSLRERVRALEEK